MGCSENWHVNYYWMKSMDNRNHIGFVGLVLFLCFLWIDHSERSHLKIRSKTGWVFSYEHKLNVNKSITSISRRSFNDFDNNSIFFAILLVSLVIAIMITQIYNWMRSWWILHAYLLLCFRNFNAKLTLPITTILCEIRYAHFFSCTVRWAQINAK